MALGETLKNGITQSLGNIEKAVIEIIDMRGRQVTVDPPVPVSGGSSAGGLLGNLGGSSLPTLSAADTFAGAAGLTDAVNDAASSIQGAVRTLAGGAGGLLTSLEGATRKTFTVQFNPSDLTVSGYGGGMVAKTNYGDPENAGSVSFEPADVRISMNVRLIFDKVDPQDAFMADKINLAPTSLAVGAAKTGLAAAGKKDNSVQAEVEGFIAALRSPFTRRITFQWGKLSYSGTLTRVSAQYTMFNVSGQPVRAFVSLSLICADPKVAKNSMGVWRERYDAAFQSGSQSFVTKAQKLGNLTNFNL